MTATGQRTSANRLKLEADAKPDDAGCNLQAALALDGVSREATATLYYERALELGLGTEQELLAIVCLVSSYRNTGRYDEALARLKLAASRFPDNIVLECFAALVLLDTGDAGRAVYKLGRLLLDLETSRIDDVYEKILRSKFRGLLTKRHVHASRSN